MIAACFVYIIRRKEKNIATFVLSGLILLTMLVQIRLDEYTRVQMLAMAELDAIKRTVLWIDILDWVKGFMILILAIQVMVNHSINDNEVIQTQAEEADV